MHVLLTESQHLPQGGSVLVLVLVLVVVVVVGGGGPFTAGTQTSNVRNFASTRVPNWSVTSWSATAAGHLTW